MDAQFININDGLIFNVVNAFKTLKILSSGFTTNIEKYQQNENLKIQNQILEETILLLKDDLGKKTEFTPKVIFFYFSKFSVHST